MKNGKKVIEVPESPLKDGKGERKSVTLPIHQTGKMATSTMLVSIRMRGELEELEAARPKTRGDCKDGIRPCPFVACMYHTYLDVLETGNIQFNFPDVEVWEMPADASCVLDMAEYEGMTMEDVGAILNVTRARVGQIEEGVGMHPSVRAILRDYASSAGMRTPILQQIWERDLSRTAEYMHGAHKDRVAESVPPPNGKKVHRVADTVKSDTADDDDDDDDDDIPSLRFRLGRDEDDDE